MLRIIVTENYIFYVCGGLEDSVVLVFLLLEFVVFMLLQVVLVVQLPKEAHARASACVRAQVDPGTPSNPTMIQANWDPF